MQSSPTHQQYYERASQVIRKSPSGRTLPGMPSPLPDPSAFPDPYPSSRYNNTTTTTTTPPVSLFSAGSSSARSSAYTSASPGSALRSSVASSDSAHGHRHPPQPILGFPPMNGPNSSDAFGISLPVPPLPSQPLHAPYSHQDSSESHFPNHYDNGAPLNASAIGVATTADEIAHSYAEPLPAAVARQVASRPGSRPSTYAEQEQTRWSSSSQADSGSKSSSWGNFDPNARHSGTYDWNNISGHQEGGMTTDDEDLYDEEPDRTAAVVLAEEGKGHIVRGEGMDIDKLQAPQGTTHLLLGASATPNRLPNYLGTVLPLICDTLLALDISANFLPSLPPALAACTNLEELNIGCNPLRVIPTWLGVLVSLRVLIVDSTGIAGLPTSLSGLVQLHTLSIRRNRMHSLPSWLCLLPILEALYVEGNPFQGPWKALLEPLVPRPVGPIQSSADPSTPQPYLPNTPHTVNSMASSGAASSDSDYAQFHSQQLSSTGNPAEYDDRTITNTTGADHASVATHNDVPWQQDPALQRESVAIYPKPHISIAASANTRPRGPSDTLSARPNTTHGEDALGHRRKLSRTKTTPTRRTSRPLSFLNSHLHNQVQALEPGGGAEHTRHQQGDSNRDVMVQTQQPAEVTSYAPPSPVRRMKSAGDIKPGVSTRPATKSMHESSTSKFGDDRHESRFMSLRSRGPPKHDYRALTATVFDPLLKDNEKGRERSKWGFLKKITTVNRPRTPVESEKNHRLGPPRQMSSPLQNAMLISSKLGATPAGLRSTVSLHSTQTSPPRRLTKKPSASTLSVAHTSTATLMPPGSSTSGPVGQMGPLPAAALSTPNLLAATNPSPTPQPQKRRSFLPVDGPSPITVPGLPLSDAIIVTGDDDQDPNTPLEGLSSLYYRPSMYDDERERERHIRNLRSVMAYLRDMCDLNAGTSQGAAAAAIAAAKARTVPPPSAVQTPDQPRIMRSRGATVGSADASHILSEASFSTTTSLTGFGAGSTPLSMFSQNPASVSFSPTSPAASIGLATAVVGFSKPASFGDYDGSGGGGNRNSSGSSHNLDEKKYKDDKGKRAMIVKEIVTTERTYVKGMQELVDIYVKPASAPVTVIGGVSTKETVVPASERKIVFNGLDSLLSFHKESFLPFLEKAYTSLECSTDEDGETSTNAALAVARVFVSHAAFMRMYSTYINNFDNAVQRIKQWSEKPPTSSGSTAAPATGTSSTSAATITSGPNPNDSLTPSQKKRIKQFLKRSRTHPRHSQLNLEGYLLLPVQRIPRYRLLLEELVRATPPKPEAYDDPLDRALAEITNMASSMNEGKRDAETRRKLVQWQTRIRGKFPSPLVQPHRRLIMDGRLQLSRVVRKIANYFEVTNAEGEKALISVECLQPEVTPRSLVAILCNDLLVLCKDPSGGKDSNGPVDLWAVLRMQTVPQPASVVHGNALRLVDNKAILYFDIPTTSDALTWARAINMHIPAISK